jgi:hypothetical protein
MIVTGTHRVSRTTLRIGYAIADMMRAVSVAAFLVVVLAAGSVQRRPVLPVATAAAPAVVAAPGGRDPRPGRAVPRRQRRPSDQARMTTAEVRARLGEPREEVVFDRGTRWTFPDCVAIDEGGKVVEVRL